MQSGDIGAELGMAQLPVPGVDSLLPALRLSPIPTDPELRSQWICEGCTALSGRTHAASVGLGLFLEAAHQGEHWRGRAGSWREWLSAVGLDETRASKLRTIARVLILEVGASAAAVAAVRDESKCYQIAARGRKLLASCTTEAERATARATLVQLVEDAPHLSRSDLRVTMDDQPLPKSGECQHVVQWCALLGEPCPPAGCTACGGETPSAAAAR